MSYESGNVWWGMDEEDYLKIAPLLRQYENELRSMQLHDAADELLTYILFIETTWRRLRVVSERVRPLVYEIDRWHRGKANKEDIQEQYQKLLNPAGIE